MQVKSNQIPDISGVAYNFFEKLSSSYLKSDLTGFKMDPKILSSKDIDDQIEVAEKKDLWTCRYTAYSVLDKNMQSAWCEGVKGPGIGEVIIAPFDKTKSRFKIFSGYGKNKKTFEENNRIKSAKITLVYSKQPFMYSTSEDSNTGKLDTIFSKVINLKDVFGFQTVPLDLVKFKAGNWTQLYVAIEILDVYKGTKYDDTCITEIE